MKRGVIFKISVKREQNTVRAALTSALFWAFVFFFTTSRLRFMTLVLIASSLKHVFWISPNTGFFWRTGFVYARVAVVSTVS